MKFIGQPPDIHTCILRSDLPDIAAVFLYGEYPVLRRKADFPAQRILVCVDISVIVTYVKCHVETVLGIIAPAASPFCISHQYFMIFKTDMMAVVYKIHHRHTSKNKSERLALLT